MVCMYVCSMYFLGPPSIPLIITPVMCSNLMCTVHWTASDSAHSYTVEWINLNTSVMNNSTVSGSTNSYTIRTLSTNVNYNVSVTAVDMCGELITSDPFTINSE